MMEIESKKAANSRRLASQNCASGGSAKGRIQVDWAGPKPWSCILRRLGLGGGELGASRRGPPDFDGKAKLK